MSHQTFNGISILFKTVSLKESNQARETSRWKESLKLQRNTFKMRIQAKINQVLSLTNMVI